MCKHFRFSKGLNMLITHVNSRRKRWNPGEVRYYKGKIKRTEISRCTGEISSGINIENKEHR